MASIDTKSTAAVQTRNLFAYENLSGVAPEKALVRAQQELQDGWSHRGRYAAIAHGTTSWPWFDRQPQNAGRNFHVHAWDMVNELLLAHSFNREPRFYQAACAVAVDWIAHFPRWQSEENAPYAWYDMAVGLRAQRLAYLLDAGTQLGLIDPATQSVFWESLQEHRRYLAEDQNIIFHNNHGFYQVVGQLAMARRFQLRCPNMAAAKNQAEARLRRMIDAQFTNEGIHREHSPDYHRMVYLSLRGVVAEGLIDDPEVTALIRRIEESLAWFVAPDNSLVRFGDSDERRLVYKPKDAERLWVTSQMRYITSKGALGAAPKDRTQGFNESGYFMARDRWPADTDDFSGRSYLAQICCFHSRAHKHADDLSIIWYEHGVPLLVDAGRFGYFGKAEPGSDIWHDGYWYSHPSRVFVESTRAHNTVEIDGRNHPRKEVKPYGSALRRHGETESGAIFSESEVRHEKVRFIRLLVWLPGKWLLIHDWLQDGHLVDHVYRQWFHFPPGTTSSGDDGSITLQVPDLPEPLNVIDLLNPRVQPTIVLADNDDKGHPRQGYTSPSENALVPAPALAIERHGASAVFATLLALQPLEDGSLTSSCSSSGQDIRLKWRQGDNDYDLHINKNVKYQSPLRFISTALPA